MLYAEADARVIADYLKLPHPKIVFSQAADENQLKNPRLFAFVEDRINAIHVSKSIEVVDPDIRIGLILHELGHIHGGMDEVVADEWVITTAPESGYHYVDRYSFQSPLFPLSHPPVVARNLQCVSRQFMRVIGHLEED